MIFNRLAKQLAKLAGIFLLGGWVFPQVSFATDYTYTGAGQNDDFDDVGNPVTNTAGNWKNDSTGSKYGVPTAGDDAIISGGPTISTAGNSKGVNSLMFDNGEVDFSGGGSISTQSLVFRPDNTIAEFDGANLYVNSSVTLNSIGFLLLENGAGPLFPSAQFHADRTRRVRLYGRIY